MSLTAAPTSATAPATIELAATATSNATSPSAIATVAFYQGTTLLSTDTTAPYAYSWTGVAAGTYSLTATATDLAGQSATSSAVSVTVSGGTYTLSPTFSGATVSVAWTAPANHSARDWVVITKPTDTNTTSAGYQYLSEATSGTLSFPAPTQPGAYEVRAFLNDGFTPALPAVPFTIGGVPFLVSAVSANPFLVDPYTGEQAGIHYALSRSANVTIRIYDAASKQLVRTLTALGQPAGAQTVLWDGKNASGALAPLEAAYYFTIDAVDPTDADQKSSYNNATTPLAGPRPSITAATVNATNVDPRRNDLVQITYPFSALGRLTIKVFDANRATIRTLINQTIRTQGSQTEIWDGRRDDGRLFQGPFSVFFDVPAGLPLNAIVLRGALPEFTNFRAEAYLIQPVFGEVSMLTYTLTKNAVVSMVITDPNGNAIRTLLSNVSQTAGARAVEWDGRTDGRLVVSVEGDYKVTLTAVDPASGLRSTRVGAIVVYK